MPKHKRLLEIHTRWVPRWHSASGKHLMLWESATPGQMLMFRTRRACREWITDRYGYIREREDLRKPPHGWHLPKAVKVFVQVHECL
jgi:hypothetical protein